VISGNPILARASLENAKKWQFQPESRKAAVLVYNFRVEGGCAQDGTSSVMYVNPPNFVSVIGCGPIVQP
jgi:hypothetical protein